MFRELLHLAGIVLDDLPTRNISLSYENIVSLVNVVILLKDLCLYLILCCTLCVDYQFNLYESTEYIMHSHHWSACQSSEKTYVK